MITKAKLYEWRILIVTACLIASLFFVHYLYR
jgi:hypothetical protein